MAMSAQPKLMLGQIARVALLTLLLAPAAAAQGNAFVGGSTPDRRPEGAPRLQTLDKSPQWYAAALTGVTAPIPPTLKFLDDQGAWFNPFNRAGMMGRYDIRGWHAAKPASDRKTN